MAKIKEIAPDLFRITTFVEPFNMQFSQFLMRDEEPLLFHTGPRALFYEVKAAVASLIDPQTLRWIGFSHFEADECATVPEWQQLAPRSEAVCSLVGKMVSVDDCLALRPAKGMADGEVIKTGKYRFRFCRRRMCPIVGRRVSCSRRQNGHSCARISLSPRWRRRTDDGIRCHRPLQEHSVGLPARALGELRALLHVDGGHVEPIGGTAAEASSHHARIGLCGRWRPSTP